MWVLAVGGEAALAAPWVLEADAFVDSEFLGLYLSVGDEHDVDVAYRLTCFLGESSSLSDCLLDVCLVGDEAESVEDPAENAVGLDDGKADIGEEMVRGHASQVRELRLEVAFEREHVRERLVGMKAVDVCLERTVPPNQGSEDD